MKPPASFPLLSREAHAVVAFHHGKEVTAQEFISRAVALSRQLPDRAYTFNLCTDRFQYMLAFCSATIAGQCTLMPPNRLPATLQRLGNTYPDNYSITDDDVATWEATASQTAVSSRLAVREIPAEQLCAIAFTSGSTGAPAPNLKYWRTLHHSTIGNAQLLLPKSDVRLNLVATVPPQHMWGLETSVLLPLFANVACSDRIPFYPQDIADALAALPGPRALISSPAHLHVLLRSKVSLTELNSVFSATAPMSQQLAAQLEQQFSTRLIEAFGSSESGIVARRATSSETLWHLSELFELNVSADGVEIQAPHLPTKVFIQDIVELVGQRQFRWLGRQQDMLNIAGKRGSLADLNRRLLAIKGVHDGVIFLPDDESERVAAMVVAPGLVARDVLSALKAEVELIFLPRPILMVDSLPRQATGKLLQRDILQKFVELNPPSTEEHGSRSHA